MDQREAITIVQQYADAVQEKYNCVKIILFGSYAKGNFNQDSDIDVAVVFEHYGNLLDRQLELMRLR